MTGIRVGILADQGPVFIDWIRTETAISGRPFRAVLGPDSQPINLTHNGQPSFAPFVENIVRKLVAEKWQSSMIKLDAPITSGSSWQLGFALGYMLANDDKLHIANGDGGDFPTRTVYATGAIGIEYDRIEVFRVSWIREKVETLAAHLAQADPSAAGVVLVVPQDCIELAGECLGGIDAGIAERIDCRGVTTVQEAYAAIVPAAHDTPAADRAGPREQPDDDHPGQGADADDTSVEQDPDQGSPAPGTGAGSDRASDAPIRGRPTGPGPRPGCRLTSARVIGAGLALSLVVGFVLARPWLSDTAVQPPPMALGVDAVVPSDGSVCPSGSILAHPDDWPETLSRVKLRAPPDTALVIPTQACAIIHHAAGALPNQQSWSVRAGIVADFPGASALHRLVQFDSFIAASESPVLMMPMPRYRKGGERWRLVMIAAETYADGLDQTFEQLIRGDGTAGAAGSGTVLEQVIELGSSAP